MSEMLDKAIQQKQWIKLGAIAAIVLLIIIFAGMSLTGNGSLSSALGIGKMSEDEKAAIIKTDGVMDIQHWVTDEGVRVYFVPAPELPMVDVNVTFDAGSARDSEIKGVAFMTNALLSEGTQDMDADELAEEIEFLGAQLDYDVHRDMATIHLRSLTEQDILTPAVKLMSEVISKPAFPEKAFNREQQNALKLLAHESQSPNKVAQRSFYNAIYQDQPYANWPHGTVESIEEMSRDDLEAFHKKYYVANNVVVTIVGAIDVDGANAIANALTEELEPGEKAPQISSVKPLTKADTHKISFPSAQTHIVMGAPTMTRTDTDYFPLYVGNHILGGGGMVTRLFNNVREEKGLAYDVHSYFLPMRVQGPFMVGCQTKQESAEEALKIMKETVQSFIKEGPTEEELEDAKLNLLGGFPLRFDSNRSIASHVNVIAFYDLPVDHYDQYKKQVEQVTKEDIVDAYKRRIDLEKMATVMVGNS